MKFRLLLTLSSILFINFLSQAQVSITVNGPTDACGGTIELYIVNSQAGWDYEWFVLSNTCSGINQVPMGPLNTNDTILVSYTGKYFCIGTDTLGNQFTSNNVAIRIIPGSMNSSLLPAPYPSNAVSCLDSVSLCVPTDFYQNFTTTIAWYKDNVLITGATAAGYIATLPGWYKYSITSPCVTDFSDSVEFINPMTLPLINGTFAFCQGSSTVLSANGGYTSYLWSTGATTQSINVNTAGTYTVSVSNAAGCTATASAVITENPNPVPVITGTNLICQGSATVFDAGPGFISYAWSNGAATQSISVGTTGIYTVTVTDVNGCTGSDDYQLSVSAPSATISGDNTICNGNTTDLTVQFIGSPPYSFSYSNGTTTFGPFATNTNPVIFSVSPAVNTTYFLVNYSDALCAGTVSGSATIITTTLIPVITGDTTLCQTQTGVLDAGSGWSNYLWSTGAQTQTITISIFNNYTVTVTDANGCTGSDNIVVGPTPPYSTILSASGPLGICRGDSVQLVAQSPMIFYQWYRNNVIIPGATSSSFWAKGYGKYRCQSLDASGCAANSNLAFVRVVCFPPAPPVDKLGETTDFQPAYTVFPNPSADDFYLEGPELDLSELWITDLSGKSVSAVFSGNGGNQYLISGLNAGIYVLRISGKSGTEIHKLVKIQ